MAAEYPYRYKYGRAAAGRRQKMRPFRFLALLTVLCALAAVLGGRIFVVREFEIIGNAVKGDAEIAARSGLNVGMNILMVDKNAVARNISADRYVEVIEVQTILPDTVRIEIRERSACAAVNSAGVILLIDEQGNILERMSYVPNDRSIIVVNGLNVTVGAQSTVLESGTAGQMRILKSLLQAITHAEVGGWISELNVADPDNLYLITASGMQVLLGDDMQLDGKLMWMQAVMSELLKDGVSGGILDVSTGKNAVYAEE